MCSIPAAQGSTASRGRLYASGSEEKVIRVLEAPQAFFHTLSLVRGERVDTPASTSGQVGERYKLDSNDQPPLLPWDGECSGPNKCQYQWDICHDHSPHLQRGRRKELGLGRAAVHLVCMQPVGKVKLSQPLPSKSCTFEKSRSISQAIGRYTSAGCAACLMMRFLPLDRYCGIYRDISSQIHLPWNAE